MPKYFETKKDSLEQAVLEAMSPAQQAAIAISKKEKGEKPKDEKDEGNAFGKAVMSAKKAGKKEFVFAGKKYNKMKFTNIIRFVERFDHYKQDFFKFIKGFNDFILTQHNVVLNFIKYINNGIDSKFSVRAKE